MVILTSRPVNVAIHRMIADFSQWLQWVADHMGPAEFLPSNWLVDLMADYGCGDQVHFPISLLHLMAIEVKRLCVMLKFDHLTV